jgi:nucleotide-binding universal stress UspA family protein
LFGLSPFHLAGFDRRTEEPMSRAPKRSIVVGVDFGPGGDDAIVESLKRMAQGWATELHGVHVLDPSDVFDHRAMPALFSEEKFLEQAPEAIRTRIEELARAESVPLAAPTVQVHARIGKTVEVLLQVAADYDADLIVVGAHEGRGFGRLLGSVPELLVRSATCSVLTARAKDHSRVAKTERPVLPYRSGEQPAPRAEPVDRPMHISTEPSTELPTGIRIV